MIRVSKSYNKQYCKRNGTIVIVPFLLQAFPSMISVLNLLFTEICVLFGLPHHAARNPVPVRADKDKDVTKEPVCDTDVIPPVPDLVHKHIRFSFPTAASACAILYR